MREREFFIRQSRAFVAEEQRHRTASTLGNQTLGTLAHIEYANVLIAIARRSRNDEAAVGDSRLERVDDRCTLENVGGTRSARARFGVRKFLGADQHEFFEAHVFHGARHRPDVAGVGGLDENDADVGDGNHARVILTVFLHRSLPVCSHYSTSPCAPRVARPT